MQALVAVAKAKAATEAPAQGSANGGGGGGSKESPNTNEAAKKKVDPLEGKQFGRRRPRKKKFRSRIPWELLDNLDAQKQAVQDVGKNQYKMRSDAAKAGKTSLVTEDDES